MAVAPILRFLHRKPRVLLALPTMLLMCSLNLAFPCRVMPRYEVVVTSFSVWPGMERVLVGADGLVPAR